MNLRTDLYSIKSPTFPRERADCAVRALMVAAGMTYEAAHRIYAKNGRETGRRTRRLTQTVTMRQLGFIALTLEDDGGLVLQPTVTQFIKANPRGRYIVRKRGHLFAVIDGVVHNWKHGVGPRTRVTHAWVVK